LYGSLSLSPHTQWTTASLEVYFCPPFSSRTKGVCNSTLEPEQILSLVIIQKCINNGISLLIGPIS
jgi:hypothetical protein